MSLINIIDLTFAYHNSYDNIFENVFLQIDTNWKIGLIGRNGKGKTTLMKLFYGEYEYSGKIESKVNFDYFPFAIKNEYLSVREIISSIIPDFEEWKIQRELSLLKTDINIFDKKFNTLSKGEQTKVQLAVLFTKTNSFLLIDEPTNHLDLHGREVLSEYLKQKAGFIVVSHDRAFLDNCINHILSINKTTIEIQSGNCSSYLQNKKNRDEFEYLQNKKIKSEIERLQTASEQTTKWSDKVEATKFGGKQSNGLRPDRGRIGSKAAKMMKRAKVIEHRYEDLIEDKSKLLKNIEREDFLKINLKKYFSDNFLYVKELVIKFDKKTINKPLTFEVIKGDRIALTGKNGCGKTSIIKILLGQLTTFEGEIKVASGLKISYVSQDTSFLSGTLGEFCYDYKIEKSKLLTVLFKFGFDRIQFEKNIEAFSEGQKKKLLIAKSLCEEANLYIWDEPLNYIDIISRTQITDLILQNKLTMIFVEHDKYFCETVSTKEIKL
jgi:lincosamide and streptogramin A transport system ATP-binding/permease protein